MISTANQFVLANNQDFSEALKHITSLADMLTDLANQIGLNSKNSSIPPSKDTRQLNTSEEQAATQKNKPIKHKQQGGQEGHKGCTLKQVDNPDKIVLIPIDFSTLPEDNYIDVGVERRQVTEIVITKEVIEYQAQTVMNSKRKILVATFPKHVTHSAQYGMSVKLNAVYIAIFQLLPYDRLQRKHTMNASS